MVSNGLDVLVEAFSRNAFNTGLHFRIGQLQKRQHTKNRFLFLRQGKHLREEIYQQGRYVLGTERNGPANRVGAFFGAGPWFEDVVQGGEACGKERWQRISS